MKKVFSNFPVKEKNLKSFAKKNSETFHGLFDALFKWARKKSITLMVVNPWSCCTEHLKELKTSQSSQIGSVITQNPCYANVLVLCGAVTHKMAPVIRHLYDQMEKPNWVIALGSCASGGGVTHYSYTVSRDLRKILPVDIFVPGCPVTREGLIEALDKIVKKT